MLSYKIVFSASGKVHLLCMPTIFCYFPLVRHGVCFQFYCVNCSSVTTLECHAVTLVISIWQTPNSRDRGKEKIAGPFLSFFGSTGSNKTRSLYSTSDLTEPGENGVIQSRSSLKHGLESSLTLQPLGTIRSQPGLQTCWLLDCALTSLL